MDVPQPKHSWSTPTLVVYDSPVPWQRTGPGNALDGKPKFDLTKFNPEYFTRLRERVVAAGRRGMYVSVMLFEGDVLHYASKPWCWDGHPFNAANNINGINGDPDSDRARTEAAQAWTFPRSPRFRRRTSAR